MRLSTAGIVLNEAGQVLLIKRDDTRTWAPPAGTLEAGELPDLAVVREVREETGVTVAVTRLLGVSLWPVRPDGYLSFLFHCRPVDGALTRSAESLEVAYYLPDQLPVLMANLHRERVRQCLEHTGDAPFLLRQPVTAAEELIRLWLFNVVYPLRNFRRWLRGQPRYASPPRWGSAAFAIIRDDSGAVLWVRRTDYDVWNLPGGQTEEGEAPWETAVRETVEETGLQISLDRLSGVYLKPQRQMAIFAFSASVTGGQLTPGPESADFAYFAPGAEPPNTLPKHVERVADAAGNPDQTIFRQQVQPPGLALLGLAGDDSA